MLRKGIFLLTFFIVLSNIVVGQTIKQFNGKFTISSIKTLGNNQFTIAGEFSDVSNTFTAAQVLVGDQIIDMSGNGFNIVTVSSVSGSVITTVCTDLVGGLSPKIGVGIIFRPSSKGYPLITTNTPAAVLTSTLNTATLSINSDIPKFEYGSTLPTLSATIGDVVFYSKDSKYYKLTATGWSQFVTASIPKKYNSTLSSIPIEAKGNMIYFYMGKEYYYSDGKTWVVPPTVSALPTLPKFGDIYYETGQKKLFMLADGGDTGGGAQWMSISSSGIAGGGNADFPTSPGPGDLFFNKDNNTLYIYDIHSQWEEVSTNGSNPAGFSNPDPSSPLVKEGQLFYNTSEKRLFVYNGTDWLPVGNSLGNGQIFVGNTSNVATPVPLTGDATITNTGKLTIKDLAVTDSKLDKSNIPLSGFGNPVANVSMGDGTTNYKITNLQNPSSLQDAATKAYIDNLFANPSVGLTLANGNFLMGNPLNKAAAVTKSTIPLSGFGNPTANISMNGKLITNLAAPSNDEDAVNKAYVDNRKIWPINIGLDREMLLMGNDQGQAGAVEKKDISFSDFGVAKADVSLGGFKLSDLAEPTLAQDAATKNYVDIKIIDPTNISLSTGSFLVGDASGKAVATLKNTIPLSGFSAAASDISLGTSRIINLGAPIADTDASTKKYVDDLLLNPVNTLALPAGNLFVGNSFGKAAPTLKSAIPVSGFGKATENVFMGDPSTQYNISYLAEPMDAKDAATKNYVDSKVSNPSSIVLSADHVLVGNASNQAEAVAKNTISLSDFAAVTSNLSLSNYKITNLGDPTDDLDAVNKKYVAAQLSGVSSLLSLPSGQLFVGNASGKATATAKSAIPLSGFGAATADVSLGNFKLTNLADPTADQEAATKKYVDNKSGSVPGGTTPPSNPVPGSTYYNTTEKVFYVYDGTSWVPVDNSLPNGQLYVGDATNKAKATDKTAIPLSGFGTAEADIALGNHKITGLADPTADQEAATKKYVDSKSGSVPGGTTPPSNPVPGSTYYNTVEKVFYVYDGTSWVPVDNSLPNGQLYVGDATNKAKATDKTAIPLSGFGAAEADIALGNHKITGLADPTADQEAATKKYVDGKTGSVPSGPTPPTSPVTGSTYYNTTDKTFYVYDGTQWVPVSNASALAEGQFLVGDASNKAVATAKTAIPLSGFGAPVADVSMGGKRILDLATPMLKTDAATKDYVDVLVNTVGGNYMDRATYDANANDKVDDAEKVNGLTVETSVPVNAVFTDDKVKVGASGAPKALSSSDFDDSGADIIIKNVSFSKMEPIAANSIIGNNTASPAVAKALTPAEVKSMLALDKVDNTADATKNVLSATRLTTPISINGMPFDGSGDITLPGDNLGSHEAAKNIKMGSYSISNSGVNGQGLSFDTPGNATFSQDITINGNMYTPSDSRLKTKVETLTGVLQEIDQMRGVSFEYIDQTKYAKGPKIGVIAQELQKIYPGMVTKGSDGFFKVDYTQLTAVLIQAVKEQQALMLQQQKEISDLKSRLDKQQQQIDEILKKIK